MSGYRRLISYLYSYNSGLKTKNVGFAKVERRGDAIKILVNLKGAYSEEEEYDVYFFIRRDDWQLGISLGKMTIKNGNGDFRRIIAEDELQCDFDDVCGMYIAGENMSKIFASGWDDKYIDVNHMRPFDKTIDTPEAAMPEISTPEAAMPGLVPYPPIWERPIREKIYVMQEDSQTPKEQEMARTPIEKETAVLMQQEMASVSIEQEMMSASAEYENGETGENDWEKLFAPLEDRRVFCDDEIYDCTDISLEELSQLPEGISAFANNSFVNHAFYNFHHLLIAKFVEKGDKKGLFFGVPGVYDRRERVIAGMFGFDKFKFSMRSDVNLLHFGYWYKEY